MKIKNGIHKIKDETYFKIGDIFGGMKEAIDRHEELVVSASFLKNCVNSSLYSVLMGEGFKPDNELKKALIVGSAWHCYILENIHFEDRFYVADFPIATQTKNFIDKLDLEFIEETHKQIEKKYPEMLDNQYCEATITSEIDGVPCKCKIDKMLVTMKGNRIIDVDIVDLKSVYFDPFKKSKGSNGDLYGLRRELSSLNYDLQAYFYVKMVESWLQSCGQHANVSFSILTGSKDTHDVQKFRVGEEMMRTGEEKFNSVWGEVKAFVQMGKTQVSRELVL